MWILHVNIMFQVATILMKTSLRTDLVKKCFHGVENVLLMIYFTYCYLKKVTFYL